MNGLANRVLKFAAVVACIWGVTPALADWTYDAELNTVTVGDWVFNSAVEGDGIALVSLKTAGAATTLDFSTCATAGAPKIVRAADKLLCSANYVSLMPNVTDLILPNDMVEIGMHAFRAAPKLQRVHLPTDLQTLKAGAFAKCPELVSVQPFLPQSLTFLGASAFGTAQQNSGGDTKLRGDLILSNPGLELQDYARWEDAVFYLSGIDSVDFTGSQLTTLPLQMFRECPNMTKVVLPETFEHFPVAAFYKNTKLKEVWFRSFADPLEQPTAFYQSGANFKTRFCYPSSSKDWDTYVKGQASFVRWEDAGNNTNTYLATFNDGLLPIGYVVFRDKDQSESPRARWVVPYTVSTEGATLSVSGSPVACTNVTPTCGTYEDVKEKVSCTAEQYALIGPVLYESIGYRWDVLGELAKWVEGEPVYGSRETVFDKTAGVHGLVWLWGAKGYQVALSDVSEFGTVERPVPFYGEDYYETNSVITLTPVPVDAGARFVRWDGDVAEADRTANPLTLTVDRAKAITPVFSRDWTYDETAGTISDGYWTLSVAGDRTALTVVGPAAGSVSTWAELYLGKPIIGGGRIVEIGASAFREITTLKIVTLPENLIRLDACAFYRCSQLEKVTPFLPVTLEYLGGAAFNQTAKLVQDLKLNCPKMGMLERAVSDAETQMFYGSGITSVDMSGSGITNIGANVFRSCSRLKWVKLSECLEYIGGGAFMENPALESVTPFLPDTLTYLGDSAFTKDTKLAGDLVLSNPNLELSGDYMIHGGASMATFYDTLITSIDMTRCKVEVIPQQYFRNCAKLKTVLLPKTFSAFSESVFYQDSSLEDVRFRSFPDLNAAQYYFSKTTGDYKCRLVYPHGDAGWEGFIAADETFVAWKDAGEATNTYYATFADRWRPAGYVTFDDGLAKVKKWLVPRSYGAGTMVLIQ